MKVRHFKYETAEEAQAFIDGVQFVNDSSIRVKTVTLETTNTKLEVVFEDIGGSKLTLPVPMYVVHIEDLDANEDDE